MAKVKHSETWTCCCTT